MKKTLLLTCVAAFASAAFAQTNVFRCFDDYTTSYGPTGATGAAFGQPDVTQWTSLPERGSQLHLDAAGNLSEISFSYLCNALTNASGGEKFNIMIYALNPGGTARAGNRSGQLYTEPFATPLWTSPDIPTQVGDRTVNIKVPNIAVPQDIVVTYKFGGGRHDTEPFDPALSLFPTGGRFVGKTTHGSLPTTPFGPTQNGLVWRRVYTAAGASIWGVQEVPATFGATGWGFGFSLYTGNTSTLTEPWNNEIGTQWAYADASLNPMALNASVEGPNTVLTNCNSVIYADTTSNPNGGSYVIKVCAPVPNGTSLWGDLDGAGTPGTVLWTSPAQTIPGNFGTAGSGTLIQVDIPMPNVVVPSEFVWTIEFTGLIGGSGDNAGPGLIFSPEPGTSPNGIWLFNNAGSGGWDGPYVFEANVGGLYVNASQMSAAFTGTTAVSTETLAPTSEQILLGTTGSGGNLASWASNDGNIRNICKFFVPFPTSPFIRANLNYTTTKAAASVTAISFNTRIGSKTGGGQAITLKVQNKTTSAFVNTSVVNQSVGSLPHNSTGAVSGTLSNFVGSGGAMTGQIEISAVGFQVVAFPCTGFDSANMVVTG